jgi:hypothetical protein
MYLRLLVSGIFVHQDSNPVDFNPSSRKSYCLTLTAIYFHPIFYDPLPQGVQILLQLFYVSFYLLFFYCYTVVGEESNIRVDVPPNIIYVHKKQ